MQSCKSCSPPRDPHILPPCHPLPMNTQHLFVGTHRPLLFYFWLTQKTTKQKSEATEVTRAECAYPAATSPGLCQGGMSTLPTLSPAGHPAARRVAEVGFGDFRATEKKTRKETCNKKELFISRQLMALSRGAKKKGADGAVMSYSRQADPHSCSPATKVTTGPLLPGLGHSAEGGGGTLKITREG